MQGEVTDFGDRAHENWKEGARILDAELCHGSWTAVRGLATVLICTNRRLASADDNRVAFRWKDYRIDRPDRWKTKTLHSGANATSRRLRHSTALARVHPAVHVLPKKAQAAPTARPKVPTRRRGADCLVVAMKAL